MYADLPKLHGWGFSILCSKSFKMFLIFRTNSMQLISENVWHSWHNWLTMSSSNLGFVLGVETSLCSSSSIAAYIRKWLTIWELNNIKPVESVVGFNWGLNESICNSFLSLSFDVFPGILLAWTFYVQILGQTRLRILQNDCS